MVHTSSSAHHKCNLHTRHECFTLLPPLTVIVVSVPGIPAATLYRRVTAAGSLPVLSDAVRERGEQRDAAAEDGSGLADEAGRAVPEAGEHGQEPAGGKHVGNEEELQHVERLCSRGGGGRQREQKGG